MTFCVAIPSFPARIFHAFWAREDPGASGKHQIPAELGSTGTGRRVRGSRSTPPKRGAEWQPVSEDEGHFAEDEDDYHGDSDCE